MGLEIRYYHLEQGELIASLTQLLMKCLERSWRVAIYAEQAKLLTEIDQQIWLAQPARLFLAHGLWLEGDEGARAWAAKQPILLIESRPQEDRRATEALPNHPDVIFALNGFSLSPLDYQHPKLSLLCHLFDGRDEAVKSATRTNWQSDKSLGYSPQYYQQTSEGWQLKS